MKKESSTSRLISALSLRSFSAFFGKSIARHTLLPLSIGLIALAALSSTFASQQILQKADQFISEKAKTATTTMAQAAEDLLWQLDSRQAALLLRSLENDNDFVSGKIRDITGKIIAEHTNQHNVPTGEQLATEQQAIYSTNESERVKLGTIQLSFSKTSVENRAKIASLYLQIASVVFAILVSGLVLLVSYFIARRVKILTNGVDLLSQGKIDTKLPDTNRKDEIGRLANAITAFQKKSFATASLGEDRERWMLDARKESEAKANFLVNTSDEIQTRLSEMLGMSNLLIDTGLSSEQQNIATTINQSGDSLLSLINGVLDFIKIESGYMKFDYADMDLSKTVAEVTDMLSIKAREKNLELIIEMGPEVPPFITCDSARLKQILSNLIGNAIKYTYEGHIITRIFSRRKNEESIFLRIEVEDTGIGIDNERRATIFDNFAEKERDFSQESSGMGLGLAISSRLVELIGGTMNLTSDIGKGTKFYFEIPVKTAPVTYVNEMIPDISLGGLRVLIIDDYQQSCDVIQRILLQKDILCDSASTLENANSLLSDAARAASHYKFILINNRNDQNNALLFSQKTANNPTYGSPMVIMITGHDQFFTNDQLVSHGVSGVILKPVYYHHLDVMMKLLLEAQQRGEKPRLLTRQSILQMTNSEFKKEIDGAHSFEGMRVLVADDMQINRMILTKILEKFKCEIVTANDGLEAVSAFKEKKFDLVFMDCQMPNLDGFKATQEIRNYEETNATGHHATIIAVTADAMSGDREKSYNAGMDDYIHKPFKQDQIGIILDKWSTV